MRRFISSLLALSCITANPVLANDDDKWWFDIEVILFARDASIQDIPELFERQSLLTAPQTDWDLLSGAYQPDVAMVYNSLPVCDAPTSPLWVEKPTLEEILSTYVIEDQYNSVDTLSDDTPVTGDNQYELATITPVTGSATTNMVSAEDRDTPPPSLNDIAGYWLSFVLPEGQLKPYRIPARRLHCIESREPAFVTTTDKWHWQAPDLYLPPLNQTPLTVEGVNWPRATGPHLLPASALTQDDMFTSIRWRKGLQRLAHFSWRQQIKFGQDEAETLRLFAGQNYAGQFTQTGELRPQETPSTLSNSSLTANASPTSDTFFNELNQRLSNPQAISFASMTAPLADGEAQIAGLQNDRLSPIWQLDGFIQVYLKYLNRVPYLHINSELFYRQPVLSTTGINNAQPQYELVSVPFKQLRRVISTQLHYFDHPLFGMVVQIRRYDRPPAASTKE